MGNFQNKLIRILKKILDYIINIKSAEMKNIFLLTTFLLILFGCEKEKESDNEYNIPMSYFKNNLYFQLQDVNGNDLLDTSKTGHYKISDIEITNIPASEKPTTLVPKKIVFVEIHKSLANYYYAELGLIMPKTVGKEEYIEIETSNGKEMAWISETEPTYTNVRFGNKKQNVFKAVYKTFRIDIPYMLGGNSTIVDKIWHNDKIIFEYNEGKTQEFIIPTIIIDANEN
jgi:hypothetical protein